MERFKMFLIMVFAMIVSFFIPINTAQAEDIVSNFVYPVGPEGKLLNYHISQGYGTTYSEGYCSNDPDDPNPSNCTGTWRYGHDGLDISNYGCDNPVYAAGDGHVVHAQSTSGWGNQVRIRHLTADGYRYTLYGHLQDITISDEQDVVLGQQIGTIGNGGAATGCHLHFGVLTEDISGSGYYYTSNMPSTHLNPTDFISSHQIECPSYLSKFTVVKNAYGNFIGSATGAPHLYSNGSSVCIQNYDNSGSSWGPSAILFDSGGNARRAYLVRSGFWVTWTNRGGPLSSLGMPITNEYTQGPPDARLDFLTKTQHRRCDGCGQKTY